MKPSMYYFLNSISNKSKIIIKRPGKLKRNFALTMKYSAYVDRDTIPKKYFSLLTSDSIFDEHEPSSILKVCVRMSNNLSNMFESTLDRKNVVHAMFLFFTQTLGRV